MAEWSLEPDEAPTVEEEPLAGEEVEALKYWKEFLPKTVASLKRSGPDALENRIRRAWYERERAIALQLERTPALHRYQVEELFREMLFPPPER